MRPVTASHALRKSYNKALDDGDNDPYTSVYGRNFGVRTDDKSKSK